MAEAAPDAELVRAALGGDAARFGALIARHRAGMRAVAIAVLGYGPDADDAVQDATLLALGRIGDLRSPTPVPWLRAIVRRTCLMRLRAARREEPVAALAERATSGPSPEARLEQQALGAWVWAAVDRLSEPLQVVVLLRYFSGVTSYADLAAMCGVPVGTVRSRLSEARRQLAGALDATADEAHDDDASRRRAAAWRDGAELLAAGERGRLRHLLDEIADPHFSLVGPQQQRGRGRDLLVQIMECDLAAGVRQRIFAVAASRSFTIMECELLSPHWDPEHCPPAVAWLSSWRGEQLCGIRLFHPQPGANFSDRARI